MTGLIRAYTYNFQPDILAEIERARALTPPEILAVSGARRLPRLAVEQQISRSNLVPFDGDPLARQYPAPSTHLRPHSQPDVIRPGTLGRHSFQESASTLTSSHRRCATITSTRSASSRTSSGMARPGSSNRPTHINLPSGGFTGRSPNGSPLNTPASPTSPRSSFLPSFMRTRSRAATMTNANAGRAASPSVEAGNPFSGTMSRGQNGSNQSGGIPASNGVTRSVSTPLSGNLAAETTAPIVATPPVVVEGSVKTHRIRLVPHLETSRSLAFDPVIRELMPIYVPPGTAPSVAAASISTPGAAVNGRPPALVLKIGRFTDKPLSAGAAATAAATAAVAAANGSSSSGAAAAGGSSLVAGPTLTIAGGGGDVCSGKVAFKSKVVSRAHAEIWCESGGKFYIRDTSSSSGTFLNHIRLSSPNTDSRPTMLNDGDVLQLGVDYQGGHEDMFRCVKMRVELGREWQRAANEFNTNALKQLKALGGGGLNTPTKAAESPAAGSSKKGKTNVTDCCICLFSVTVCQSLFIAPCSHVFHYKCIRPLLMQHHPGFSCPLCRTFANLEEDVETEDAWEIASRRASVISRRPSNHSIRLPPTSDRAPAHPGADAPDGEPSTVVGFGDTGASIDDLLAGDSGSNSSQSAAMANSTTLHHPLPPALLRQMTAVQADDEVDMPQTGYSGAASTLYTDSSSGQNTSTGTIDARAIPSFAVDPFSSAADVQTPMNDTFLSTLAPSVHQRLDLARQMDEVGRGNEPLEEEPTGVTAQGDTAAGRTSEEGWMQVDNEDRDVTEARRDMEMMFT